MLARGGARTFAQDPAQLVVAAAAVRRGGQQVRAWRAGERRRWLSSTAPDTAALAVALGEPLLAEQPYDYYAVLDLEATCEQGRRNGPSYQAEVIELPTVLLDGRTMRVVDEFQSYVRPAINPTLTAFCTELTGIQQNWVDGAPAFEAALRQHTSWLRQHGLALNGAPGHSWVCVTCGDWDLKTMLPDQLRLLHRGDSGRGVKARTASRKALAKHFQRWVNIKQIYAKCVPTERRQKASADLRGMLRGLGLTLEGRHHSGIDDCRNIANVVRALAQRGAILECTTGGGGAATSARQGRGGRRGANSKRKDKRQQPRAL
jgi:inhibitor of KinA sporulation pathway (predicted exonuclease)